MRLPWERRKNLLHSLLSLQSAICSQALNIFLLSKLTSYDQQVKFVTARWSKDHIAYNKQALIDIRLCPGIATSSSFIAAQCSLKISASRPLRPNVTSSIKPEVHNVSQHRWRKTEPRPQRICTQNFVPESVQQFQRYACGQTDRQTDTYTDRCTDRQVDHNTLHPYRRRVNIQKTKLLGLLYSREIKNTNIEI